MGSERIKRISYYEVATFATAAPTNGTTPKHLPFVGESSFKEEVLFDSENEAHNDGLESPEWPTVKGGKFSFKVRAYTMPYAADGAGGDSPAGTELFLKSIIENYFNKAGVTFAGTTVAAPGTGAGKTAPVVFTSVTDLSVGQIVMFGDAGETIEARAVESISGSNVTLDADLTVAANYNTGSIIYGSTFFRRDTTEYAKYLYFNVEYATYSRLFGPCWMTKFGVEGVNAKEGVRFVFEGMADNWVDGFTPSASPYPFNPYLKPLVAIGSPFALYDGTSMVQRKMTGFSMDFGNEIEEKEATEGTRGRAGRELVESRPSGKVTPYFAATDVTDWVAGSHRAMRLHVPVAGSSNLASARGGIGIYVPNAKLEVERTAIKRQEANAITWKAKRPTTAQQTAGITWAAGLSIFGLV